MIDHVGFEVSDLERAARFYDAVFFALGWRRMHATDHALAWGVDWPQFWITARRGAAPAYGHVALRATRAQWPSTPRTPRGWHAGGCDDGAAGPAAALRARRTTRPICETPTACASR